jgi:hypothetical protein
MKTAELQALGLTQEQIDGVFKINGIDVENAKAGKDKIISDLTAERNDLKARLTTAETTLKGFGGIDSEKLQGATRKRLRRLRLIISSRLLSGIRGTGSPASWMSTGLLLLSPASSLSLTLWQRTAAWAGRTALSMASMIT